MCKISAQYVKECRRKVRNTVFSYILSSQRGITPSKIDSKWQHSNLLCSIFKQSHVQNFSSICQSMQEKTAENCVIPIFKVPKEAQLLQKLTKKNVIRTCSEVHQNKVMCKISAQYVKACRRKVQKTVNFLYSKFTKRHNSFNNWRKVMTLKLDL